MVRERILNAFIVLPFLVEMLTSTTFQMGYYISHVREQLINTTVV